MRADSLGIERLGHDEGLAERRLKRPARSRELEVLPLVVPDRHELGAVEQDVGRHEHRDT